MTNALNFSRAFVLFNLETLKLSNLETLPYRPGIFIPASRRAKLGFPIDLNIFRICAY